MTYKEQLEQLSDKELCSIHNIYCDNKGYNDNIIFDNDEDFFDTYFGKDVIGAVRAGDYDLSHKYVKFDGYANLESTDNIRDFMDMVDIANDIEDNYSDYSQYIEEEEEEEEV